MAAASYNKPLLHGNALKMKLFKGLEDLMPMPQVILKAQMMLTNPNSSFEDLANVIETDPEITLQVLNVVNSAYYSLQSSKRGVFGAPGLCDAGTQSHRRNYHGGRDIQPFQKGVGGL